MEVALKSCARDPHDDMAREFCRRGGVQLYNAVLFDLNVKAILHAPFNVSATHMEFALEGRARDPHNVLLNSMSMRSCMHHFPDDKLTGLSHHLRVQLYNAALSKGKALLHALDGALSNTVSFCAQWQEIVCLRASTMPKMACPNGFIVRCRD
jgi:hypothetical protein